MKTVYIAGPFRADNAWLIERNIRVAEETALAVAAAGAAPLCPHTMYRYFQGALPDSFWLEATLELARRCDAIIMCDDWENSSGSMAEHDEMCRLGKPVFHEGHLGELANWIIDEAAKSESR